VIAAGHGAELGFKELHGRGPHRLNSPDEPGWIFSEVAEAGDDGPQIFDLRQENVGDSRNLFDRETIASSR